MTKEELEGLSFKCEVAADQLSGICTAAYGPS